MIIQQASLATHHTHTHASSAAPQLRDMAVLTSVKFVHACVCDVGMPVVFVIIRIIPPLFAYFLALPSLLPSAITIIVFLYLL